MPPESFFRPHGSTDEDAVAITGGEFFRVMKYFSRKFALALSIIFAIIAGATPLVMNAFMGDIVNVLNTPGMTHDQLVDVVLRVTYLAIFLNVIMTINFGMRGYSNPAFMADLRRELYTALMKKDISFFDITPTGVLISRLSQDVTLLYQIYIDKFLMAVQNLTQVFGGVLLALIIMWRVALPCVGVMIICALIYAISDKIIDKLWEEFNTNSSTATSKAEEVITSFRTVKSFDNELFEAGEYRRTLKSVNSVFDKTSIAQGLQDGLIFGLVNAMIAGMLYLGSWYVVEHPELGYVNGDMIVVLMSLWFSAIAVSLALSLTDDFKKARVSAAKILKILETPPAVDQEKGEQMEQVVGKIEFRDVGFKYATREDWAVRHLSFTVNAGETVALIGESGCGKSTTLQLLQRFYEIQEGQILIDDVDIATLSPKFLRSQIAVVPQGPVLFTMSVRDNIKYAKSKASDDDVANAARVGNAHNFIMEMPENYDSMVQQTSLSGGQKQRICISRAILADAPILLLDEATAALDTESEQLVQQSLETFRQGKTAILVAHRLATVIHADRIFVFQEGHIVETGTHTELMAKNGIYSDLVKYQLQ